MLTNPRHEQFADLVAKGLPAQRAYVMAGFATGGAAQSASRLLRQAKVAARVAEIRATLVSKAAVRVAYELASAMDEAEQARVLAMEARNPRAAVAAVELKAKLNGLLVERKEVRTGLLDELSHDELQRIERALAESEEGDASRGGSPAEPAAPAELSSIH